MIQREEDVHIESEEQQDDRVSLYSIFAKVKSHVISNEELDLRNR